VRAEDQLAALAGLARLFEQNDVESWLFGGWAVDFHAGRITRDHDDLDLAVWSIDAARADGLLRAAGWTHAPEDGEDGFTSYVRGGVRLELAFLARDEGGLLYTPLRDGDRASWPEQTFEREERELGGVRARVVSLPALLADKSESRDDARVAAKDRADVATLAGLGWRYCASAFSSDAGTCAQRRS
jgi:hypothetical protein